MGALTSSLTLWPAFSDPADLVEVEQFPLSERGLPATTYELVKRAAELWPDRPALSVLPDAERFHTPLARTFPQLARDVHGAAAVLARLGVRRGNPVAVISVNCAEMLPLLLAAEAVGSYAPINPALAPEHAVALLRLSGAKVIVASGPELDEGVWTHPRTIAHATAPKLCSRCAQRHRPNERRISSRSRASMSHTCRSGWRTLRQPSCPDARRPTWLLRAPGAPCVRTRRSGTGDTGDLASVDGDGFIRLPGRAKDLIIRGGHNIDPAAIEDALLEHPDVTAAAAVGRPDRHSGEVPVAFVAISAGSELTADVLEGWAAEHVPERAAAPKHVEVVDEIPLTSVGKLYKPELRRRAAERAARDALDETDLVDQVRAVLVDGAVEIHVPHSAEDEAVVETLSEYAWTWRLTNQGDPNDH